MKSKLVVFTGAGISAESGIKTFRDSDGLWEEYNIQDVATPQAWAKNKSLVLDFYNKRRHQVLSAKPNQAHLLLAQLQDKYDVQIITQNIDDLHERAGSKKVLHLHGEIMKSRSTLDSTLIYPIKGPDLHLGETCEKGSQLRPHIVWFGELVPAMEIAYLLTEEADLFMVIGTSLAVYPAAGIVDYAPDHIQKYLIDPADVPVSRVRNLKVVKDKACSGLATVVKELLK
ncbi:MAG TPA: NAD-dependent deacylase [Bacteroidia bacterium]|nr:NAD-dependent deacylase [Bacteroidia bacterium]